MSDLNLSEDELFWQAPTPTGVDRVWYIDPAVIPFANHLYTEIERAKQRRDKERYCELREQLVSLPGHPAFDPGDRIEIRRRTTLITLPNAPVTPVTINDANPIKVVRS